VKRRLTIPALAALAVVALAATSAPAAAHRPVAAPPSQPADPAVAAADQFVASTAHRGTLRRGTGDTLVRRGVQKGGRGLSYVSYDRTYKNLPVVGGDVVVVADPAGAVKGSAAAQQAAIDVDTTASVSAAAAGRTTAKQLSTVASATAPRLSVLAWGTPKLTWETVVTGTAAGNRPSKLHVFVDAHTGAVVESYDEVREGTGNGFYYGSVNLSTSGSGSSFSMTDTSRPGMKCGGQNGAAYTGTDDAWGNGSGTSLETACVDAMYGAQREWDMLSAWFGRNGVTGSGSAVPIRVGLADVNAFWNGSYVNFGHNQANTRQATPIDVVAHEIGHAIFQFTPGGAGSGNENGGLNEGASDIWGALTEAYANNPNDPPDYTVGEEVDLVGQGPIRVMYNPSQAGDPNCYSSSIPSTEVHAAAGPLNHWFYLTAEGSSPAGKPASPTCDSSAVTGIGIRKAGEIFYNAELLKTSSWRYVNVRVATLTAAKNLYPGSCTEFNVVKAAWLAVSVPAQSGEPTCSSSANDFSVAVSPTSGSVAPGSSASATVSTAVTAGSAQSVSLSASGLPSGATASFSPATVTAGGSSTLSISTSASTPGGTYPITITGSGAVSHSATYSLTVTGGTGGGCSGSNGTDVAVPDAGAAVFSNITIAGCSRAPSASSSVAVNIVHTFRGDLVVDLVAPDGSTYRLKNSSTTDSADNVNTTYSVNLSGEAANGTWRLKVQDIFSQDTGFINTWTLTL
jgi:Zn-dependent metalloprotease